MHLCPCAHGRVHATGNKKITPVKLDRQIIDLLANREYIIERQKHLCAFFESESERMNEIADWLINRIKQKRQL